MNHPALPLTRRQWLAATAATAVSFLLPQRLTAARSDVRIIPACRIMHHEEEIREALEGNDADQHDPRR